MKTKHGHKVYETKEAIISEYVRSTDTVLDVGFWGQGIPYGSPSWPHAYIKDKAAHTYGIDLTFDEKEFDPTFYKKMSAEDIQFDVRFDRIFALDLIEHLPNPGKFLHSCARNLAPDGLIIITTPNCFSFFNMAMKLVREDPVTNSDHTCYFNPVTLRQLAEKEGLVMERYDYLYDVGVQYKESWKKKILNVFYTLASLFTGKYSDDFVALIRKKSR